MITKSRFITEYRRFYNGEMHIVASKLCAVGKCLELRGTWHAGFVPLFKMFLVIRSVQVLRLSVGCL